MKTWASIFAKVGSNFCQILNIPSKNFPRLYKLLPKQRNFVKYGHTVEQCHLFVSKSFSLNRYFVLHGNKNKNTIWHFNGKIQSEKLRQKYQPTESCQNYVQLFIIIMTTEAAFSDPKLLTIDRMNELWSCIFLSSFTLKMTLQVSLCFEGGTLEWYVIVDKCRAK